MNNDMTQGDSSNQGYDPTRDILPIVMVTGEDDPDIKAFMGTGFILGKNVFVTCHHCVSAPLEEGDRYAVAVPMHFVQPAPEEVRGPYGIDLLEDIEQDPTGLDFSTANLSFCSHLLRLSGNELLFG